MELKDTIDLMTSADYKDRFKAEYYQTMIRFGKLKEFCKKIELAETYGMGETPKHDCPLELLYDQLDNMGNYIHSLELRAKIENVEL